MPHLNGIDALVQLRQAGNDLPVVFLTMLRDVSFARPALEDHLEARMLLFAGRVTEPWASGQAQRAVARATLSGIAAHGQLNLR